MMSGWAGLCLLVAGFHGCAYDLSFKELTFEQADYDQVFETTQEVLVRTYQGTTLRTDRDDGRLEIGPVEFDVEGGPRQERVFVKLYRESPDVVRLELMAPIYERKIDLGDDEQPVRWVEKGSDVTQEALLLDEIMADVLYRQPKARVREEP